MPGTGQTTERRRPSIRTSQVHGFTGPSPVAGDGPSSLPPSGLHVRGRHNTTEGGRTDDDGNRNQDDEGERAQGCGQAARDHDEGARGPDGRVCGLPVADCERPQAVDAEDAREGHGGAGRGPRTGDRLPPERGGHRREQLHQGARPRDGHDHEGPGRPRRCVLQLHDAGGPGPPAHGREGAGPRRVGPQRPGEDRSRKPRQPRVERGGWAEQLHPGARPLPGHEHEGPGPSGSGCPPATCRRWLAATGTWA